MELFYIPIIALLFSILALIFIVITLKFNLWILGVLHGTKDPVEINRILLEYEEKRKNKKKHG